MNARLTDNAFPGYTYVPGQQPHPRREASGHSFQQPEPTVSHFDALHWQQCDAYLFGFDLFNHGFYWEAHEQWEAVWLCVGRRGTVADLLKALIKLAAAGVKVREGKPVGVARHFARCIVLLESVANSHTRLAGLDVLRLQAEVEALPLPNTHNDFTLHIVPR